uniref:Uncharacterized protein n=1 Tax=Octopus bimaculoides TaxID=37653 RepID=A0A0L8GC48_OCTBM
MHVKSKVDGSVRVISLTLIVAVSNHPHNLFLTRNGVFFGRNNILHSSHCFLYC